MKFRSRVIFLAGGLVLGVALSATLVSASAPQSVAYTIGVEIGQGSVTLTCVHGCNFKQVSYACDADARSCDATLTQAGIASAQAPQP